MQNLERLNSCLYKAEEFVMPDVEKVEGIKVEIYDSQAKIEHIRAYTFHPFKTTIWSRVKNWLMELFYGRTAVLVRVQGEPSDLYVRVDDLSRILNVSFETIQQAIVKEDASDFLVTHQMRQTAEKIKKLVHEKGIFWNHIAQNSVEEVMKHVGYKHVYEVVDHPRFNSDTMALTLLEIGKQLAQPAPVSSTDAQSQNSYEFEIDLPNIYVWKIENYKKIKVNLKDLAVTVEHLPKPTLVVAQEATASIFDRVTQIFTPSVKIDREKQEFEMIAKLFGVEDNKTKHLTALANRVGYANLIQTLGQLDRDEKIIMLNTFVEIGQQFSTPAILDSIFANFRLKYVGKNKENKKTITYAFAINKRDIFINQKKLGEGSFKVVSTAIKLNNLEELFVRIKIKHEKKKTRRAPALNQTSHTVREARKEAKFLEKLHKHKKEKGSSCIVLPFSCEITAGKGKETAVFFQKQYNGDGEKLKKGSLMHQLFALRDVALGLAFIHKLGFVHMDMKPANFLIEGDLDSQIPVKGKVSDFGMTVEKGSRLPGGSLFYLPPEALSVSPYRREIGLSPTCFVNEKIDSFSLGVSIIELIDQTPTNVFGVMKQAQIDQEIENCKWRLRYSLPKKEVTTKLAMLDLAKELLKHNPRARLSCAEAANRLEKLTASFNQVTA